MRFRLNPPDIPTDALDALEQMGEGPVRALLSSGQVGYGRGADIPIGSGHVTRLYVEQWLHWKSRQSEIWTKVGVISAILAAIFSFIALLK